MVLLAIASIFGLWWYQEKLRKRYAPQPAEAPETDKKLAKEDENEEKTEEVTDEYEIIEG